MSTHFGQMLGLVLRSTACTSEVCGNQPRMCPIGTPGLATSRPENEKQQQAFGLRFFNAAAEPAQLNWLAPNGTIGAVMATLAPGEKRGVSAHTGDVFTVTVDSPERTLLAEVFTGPAIVRSCDICPDAPLVLCPPKSPPSHNATERPAFEPAGFVNAAGVAIDLYMLSAKCEHLLTVSGPLQNLQQMHYASWAGQKFRARRHSDQRLLLEHTVGEILVRPCAAAAAATSASAAAVDGMVAAIDRLEQRQLALAKLVQELKTATNERLDALEGQLSRSSSAVEPPTAHPHEENMLMADAEPIGHDEL